MDSFNHYKGNMGDAAVEFRNSSEWVPGPFTLKNLPVPRLSSRAYLGPNAILYNFVSVFLSLFAFGGRGPVKESTFVPR